MDKPIIEELPLPWRLHAIALNRKERLALKDALASEMEIREGDQEYRVEADLVFQAARRYYELISG